MTFTKSTKHKVAALITGGIVLAGGGGAAYASSTTSSTSPAPAASVGVTAKAGHADHRGRHHHRYADHLLARSDYATFEVRDHGQWVTVSYDKGNLTAASSTSITVARPDGQSVTLNLASTTKFRGKVAKDAGELKTGDAVRVFSKDGTATIVAEGMRPLPAAG